MSLDEPAGPPGSTVRHLLAHASGLSFDGEEPIARPGSRRIYSNTGFDRLAEHVEASTAMSAADYLRLAVFEPLGMTTATLEGSPVGVRLRHARRRHPLRRRAAAADAARAGDAGRRRHGPVRRAGRRAARRRALRPARLGPRLRAARRQVAALDRQPATARRRSATSAAAARSCGSTRSPGVACAALTDREFGPWALDAWPALSDAVLAERA